MNKKLVLELINHNVYYIKEESFSYYITIPKNINNTNLSLELKSKMNNFNIEENDEVWVMENIKSTFTHIDNYNITLILPILKEEEISILEKMDQEKFAIIDKILGSILNSAYTILKETKKEIANEIILVNNERYKTFINWFCTRYQSRVVCKNLLELIQLFNVNATSYKKLETPVMNFVVGSYNTEIDAPVKEEKEEKITISDEPLPQTSGGFASYWLLVIGTIAVAGMIALIAFLYK